MKTTAIASLFLIASIAVSIIFGAAARFASEGAPATRSHIRRTALTALFVFVAACVGIVMLLVPHW